MKKRIERLRGMHDLLPDTYRQQQRVIDRMNTFLARAGYDTIDAPILEQSDLFLSSFGQELWQNLYTFRLHHRDLCLRPEYTASICRLYLDHYQRHTLPLRFQYAGPVFRYEAPGRGRYRQHTQLGVELFGGHTLSADAEIVQLACDALHELHIPTYRLELGHIGVASGFINRLHLDDHAARLLLSLMEQISRSSEGEQVAQARLEALYPANEASGNARNNNASGTISELEARFIAPFLSGISISFGDDNARQEVVERLLWKMERSEQIVVNLALGRGVSYYTGLVFEIHAQDEDGFDLQLCGGGRYDRLMRAVGSPRDVKACGFAFGIERLLPLTPKDDLPTKAVTQAFVIPVSTQNIAYALRVARFARARGVRTEVDVNGHGVGAGLKLAAKNQVRLALIVGDDEQRDNVVTLRNLDTGEEQVLDIAGVLRAVDQLQVEMK